MHFVVLLSALVACAAGVPVTSTNPKLQARVIGGSAVDITNVPFQLSLLDSLQTICGAVIIGSRWALTAAHCIKGATCGQLQVSAGSTSPTKGDLYKVTNIIPHEGYNSTTLHYDIALLQVERDFTWSESVQPIPLLNDEDEWLYYTIGAVSGWGLKGNKLFSKDLQMAFPVTFTNPASCSYHLYFSFDLMFCAIGAKGEDACQGDSGGPFFASRNAINEVTLNTTNAKLIGIVSAGQGCGHALYPGIYTKISAVTEWIYNKINIQK